MINTTILACTAFLELGLAAGYGLCRAQDWIARTRWAVLSLMGPDR